MKRTCATLAMTAAVAGAAFGADWTAGDLTVVKGDPVTLTESGKNNSSLTLHDSFTVFLNNRAGYKVGTDSTTVSLIAIGPDADDYGVFNLKQTTLNNESLGDNDKWRAKAVVGANGGNGVMKLGTDTSWVQSDAGLVSFTLSENAQTTETDFPALELGYAGKFNVSTIRNDNAKPLRIQFMNKSNSVDTYPPVVRSYWKSGDGVFHVEKADSSIILEGGKTATYSAGIYLCHWGYGGSLVNTILTGTSKGKLKTMGACNLYLDTYGEGGGNHAFKIASSNFVWGHTGDTILLSSRYISPGTLATSSGKLLMGVADGLPYGSQTGNLILRTNPSATTCSTFDLAGYSQKLNGIVLEGPSVVTNSAAGTATVTFGANSGSGRLTGAFDQDNIRYEKVGSGVLTLSNVTMTALCVTGGRVRIAPGSVNSIGTLAVTNATVELPANAAGTTMTVGTWLLGAGAERATFLPAGQPSNVVSQVTVTLNPDFPLVKESGSYLTCLTPANANGTDLKVRGGVLRFGGSSCANKYWKMVFKKNAAKGGMYTFTHADVPGFKFEMTLGLGNLGLFTADGRHAIGSMAAAAVGTAAADLNEGYCSSKNPYVTEWSPSLFKQLYSTTVLDPVLSGGSIKGMTDFLYHGNTVDALYDDKATQYWAGEFAYGVVFTNGTSQALDPQNAATWEEIRWRETAAAPAATSYALRRLVNSDDKVRAHPTDWELWSSANGTDWVKMDERSGQTFDTDTQGVKMSSQFAYTYNHHVPYLFEAQNADWRFDTFGKVSVSAGATLDLDSIPEANIAINALSVDLTAGAGTLTKFVPAANGRLYVTNPRASDLYADGSLKTKIELPLTVGTVKSADNLKSWTIYVDGVAQTDAELVIRDGRLVLLVHRGLMVIVR